jgi:flagellar protein FliS
VAAYAAPQQSYASNDILTASPGRLVVLLYDGAGRFFRQASAAMRAGDISRTNTALQRGEAIVAQLLATLDYDKGGEVATSLRDLYLFFQSHLREARLEKDADKVDTVVEMMGELRDSWAQIAGREAA